MDWPWRSEPNWRSRPRQAEEGHRPGAPRRQDSQPWWQMGYPTRDAKKNSLKITQNTLAKL